MPEKLKELISLVKDKEVFLAVHYDADGITSGSLIYHLIKDHAKKNNCELIKLCAKVEEELIGLEEEEAQEFLTDLGVEESGLEQIIHKGFEKLGLMSYFTAGVKEVRAWTIKQNSTAPRAAAAIHNDFEKGFIRAEVIAYNDYIECGGEGKAKEAGKMRLEGKEYIVQDGDIMHFRFNV